MTQFIIFLIIGVAGIVLGYFLAVRGKLRRGKNIIEQQKLEKEENKRRILEYMRGREKITNNEVEKLLKVSDATAERYLNELEKEGPLKQIGRSGPAVYYTLN